MKYPADTTIPDAAKESPGAELDWVRERGKEAFRDGAARGGNDMVAALVDTYPDFARRRRAWDEGWVAAWEERLSEPWEQP